MVKTIIKDDEHLFKVVEGAHVFSNDHGVRTESIRTLKLAKLGHSLTWFYELNEGRAFFYRLDRSGNYHDESEVMEGCGAETDEPIMVGTYLWFKSEGKYSTWGKMIPPKNPARRALWENFYFIPKQACRFELSLPQFSDLLDSWNDDYCSINNIDHDSRSFDMARVKTLYDDNGIPTIAVLLRRNWSNQNWRIVEVAVIKDLNGERLYDETLELCSIINDLNNNRKHVAVG